MLFLFVLKVLGEIFAKRFPETVVGIADNQQHAANFLHGVFGIVQVLYEGVIEGVGTMTTSLAVWPLARSSCKSFFKKTTFSLSVLWWPSSR